MYIDIVAEDAIVLSGQYYPAQLATPTRYQMTRLTLPVEMMMQMKGAPALMRGTSPRLGRGELGAEGGGDRIPGGGNDAVTTPTPWNT